MKTRHHSRFLKDANFENDRNESMKQAIIIDSTAYLPEELKQLPHIYQVDLQVVFEDGTQVTDSNLHVRDFIDKMRDYDAIPTTSQPSVGLYTELYQKLIDEGYETVYCIHLSSGISGTYQTALMLSEQFSNDIDSYVIDSKGAAIVIEILTRQCLLMIENNIAPEKIFETLQQNADAGSIYLMVETTENLVKSGRLNRSLAVIGNMLQVVPLLYFNELGEIVLFEKIRTKRKVKQRWFDLIQEGFQKYPEGFVLGFAHADDPVTIEQFIKEVNETFPEYTEDIYVSEMGPVIVSHTAAKSKGICLMPLIPEEILK